MTATYDLIIHGGTVMTPEGTAATAIGIRDGKIAALGDLDPAHGQATMDATGLHVLPGVIDTQVHFREPGGEHKEDLDTGTRAAIAGGVTAICEMPNTNPPTTTRGALEDKVSRAQGRAHCDFAFFAGAAVENADHLGELERVTGCVGVKVFMGSSTGSLLVPDDETITRVLRSTRYRVAFHSEDEDRLNERAHIAKESGDVHCHPVWRDSQCAIRSTRRLLAIVEKLDRRCHVLHTTTAEEMEFLATKKHVATVECTPQHLTLVAPDCYDRLGTYAQMNPPIRRARHRDALWVGIADGTVDVIGSDHAPHTHEEKAKPYPQSPSGMPGVQTLLPVMLDHMNAGKLSLERLVDLTSTSPARIYGMIGKGRIAEGFDADLTCVDLNHTHEITNDWIETRAGWTPFDGMKVTGWPRATILRGTIAMKDGEILKTGMGMPIRFDRE